MPQLKAQPLFVSDEQIITEVASLGGYTMITKEGKWALAAQHLGLKSSKAVDVQRRYEHILNGIPKDEYDDDEAADDSEGALDDGSESSAGDHEIDRIVGEKNKKGFREFLVKWQGTDETTWEPGANLSKCQAAIAKWREKYPTPVDNGGDPVYAREPSSSGRKRDVTELNDVDASRPRKRPSSAKPDVVLSGLIPGDHMKTIVGPTNTSLQWLVLWRSGRNSLVSNQQLKAEAPQMLLKWYESNLVLDSD